MNLIGLLNEMIEARERMHINATMLNSWIETLENIEYFKENSDEEE